MHLETRIEGYKLVYIKSYEDALNRLKIVSISLKPMREALLHDIKLLEQKDQNTFAKSIRLLDKFNKTIEELYQIKP